MTQPPLPPGPPPQGPPPPGPPPQGPPPQGPPPGGAAGQGTLVLTVQGSALSSNMVSPTVLLNGYAVPTSYGENVLPVTAGPIRVSAHAQWMRTYGQAEIDVDVRPGEAVRLWYAAPWHQFTTGSIGFEKQRRKGAGAFAGLMVALLLVVAAVVVLPLL